MQGEQATMGLTPIDKLLWLAGFIGQACLLALLLSRKRFRVFPIFFCFIAFGPIQNVTDFVIYHYGSQTSYFWTYWLLASFDSLLQLAVVYEMAKEVLRPTGTWVRDARTFFIAAGSVGAVLAAALSFAVDPTAPTGLFAWSIRLDLFSSLLIAELVVAMSFSAQRLGLQWRSWVMGLGQGLMLWVFVSLFVATAQSYWGWARAGRYVALDHLRMCAFIGALGYWSVVFWRNEPERKPLSPEMMQYLKALHTDLSMDLGRIQSKRK
jgi:hypothetical protein